MKALISEGALICYMALGWEASRKYGTFENTRKSRPMPELQCIYQKGENKGTTTPRTN